MNGFKRLAYAATFERDYRKLDPQTQAAVDDCIRDLQADLIPPGRRWHAIDRAVRPAIFSVDVFPNKSYKITCQVESDEEGQFLRLRRVDTHKDIDRRP